MKVSEKRRLIARAGLFIALAVVLEVLTMAITSWMRMPQGGKFISLGMIPLIAFSLMYGVKWGMVLGFAFGVIYYQLDPFGIHWIQIILDYGVAFSMVGLAGIFKGSAGGWKIYAGIIIANMGRLAVHYLSGMIFFKEYVPTASNPWIYSLTYNATYMLPTMIVCLILVPIIVQKFPTEPVGKK